MERNFEWFKEHYTDIYQLCGECYVVIKEERIIKLFSNENEAYLWVTDNNLLGRCNIQYCNGDKSAYTEFVL